MIRKTIFGSIAYNDASDLILVDDGSPFRRRSATSSRGRGRA